MEHDYQEFPNQNFDQIPSPLRRILLWAGRIFLGLFILFLLVFLSLQIPFIQHWAVTRLSGFLSKELKTEVRIQRVSVEFLDKLVLRGVDIWDTEGDSLFHVHYLRANLSSNPIAWINGRVALDNLTIQKGQVRLWKADGALKNNFQQWLEKLQSGPPKKKKPFFLDVSTIQLADMDFISSDMVKGERLKGLLRKGSIQVKDINLPFKKFLLKKVRLVSPVFEITRFEPGTAPDAVPFTDENHEILPDSLLTPMDTSKLYLSADEFQIANGTFRTFNRRLVRDSLYPDTLFDPQNLEFTDIDMHHKDVTFEEGILSSHLQHLSLSNRFGFDLKTLSAKHFSLSNRRLELSEMLFQTPNTTLGDTFILKYRAFSDFADFNNKVLMEIHFNKASVELKDILAFAPALQKNPFFQNNREEVLEIEGTLSGRVNNLRGKDLSIKLARGALFQGDFSTRNLAVKDEEYLNLRVTRLQTTMKTLKDLIPSFRPPQNFSKLGKLDFKGSFDGFFSDFVAYGDLRTNLGRAVMDMRLNTADGREKATYSGKLSLENFDLDKWSDKNDFGKITLSSEVKEGRGLTAEHANAKLTATIDSFVYKGYRYENILLNGILNASQFDGNLIIHDDNIDLDFAGEIDFKDSIPTFNFQSDIRKLDLYKLNLSKQNLVFGGKLNINLKDKTLSKMEGKVAVSDFVMTKDGKETFRSDSIIATSYFDLFSNKHFEIRSDLLEGEIVGVFDIERIPDAFIQYLDRNFPKFMERFGLKVPEKVLAPAQFSFEVIIKDAKNFTHLANPFLDSLQDVTLSGAFNSFGDAMKIDLIIPTLQFKNWNFYGLALLSDLDGSNGTLDLAVSKTLLNKKTEFSPVTVLSLVQQDTVEFGLTSQSPLFQTIENLYLNGKFFLAEEDYMVQFLPSNLVIWQQQWDIVKNNYIRFGKKQVRTKNFEFKSGDQRILVQNFGETGLKFNFLNFDLAFIDKVWNYDRLDFKGNFELEGVIQDVFRLTGMTLNAKADSTFINNTYFGELLVDGSLPNLNGQIHAEMDLRHGTQKLQARGIYVLPRKESTKQALKKGEHPPNYFEIGLDLDNFPLGMLEFFIPSGISNTDGLVDAKLKISGSPQKPNIEGSAHVENGTVTIDYLQTTYTVENGDMKISNYLFDATGAKLKDKEGNLAEVYGGITHDHLKNFGLDVQIKSDHFLCLDTKKQDNPLYYGRGIGKGDIRFSGTFQQTNIFINATTGRGTRLVIPISYDQTASEVKFVQFREKSYLNQEEELDAQISELRGVNLLLQLTATEEAEMLLVFDERAGDIIRGKGKGDIEIKVTREGTFSMNGNYFIEQGEYLFTLLNLVNKPFEVQRGGTIRWFGDPFGAEINLVAEYKGLNTPVNSLIQEYLELLPNDIRREASKPTQVDLTMLLQGPLMKPNINFDIDFPRLTGELKNYAQSKMRILKQDQNELNRQVFGLIVAGQFLPSTFQVSGADVTINTVTELLSNQLSLYLTDLISDLVTDIKFLSGVDLQIAYNSYQNVDLTQGGDNVQTNGSELQFNLQPYFLNDRLSVRVGGIVNLDENTPLGTTVNAGSLTSGDFTFEYALSSDRRLKLRAYASQEAVIGGGQRRRVGAGLSYRNEFDTFSEFLDGIKKGIRKGASR